MDVEYAFLCDYAASGPKLTAVGIGIDSIYTEAVPAAHPQMFTVIALRFTANETRRVKAFEMHVQDADAKDIIPPLEGKLKIQGPAKGKTYRIHQFVNGLYSVTFDKFGDYQVSWLIDGIEVQTLRFRVTKPPSS